METELLLLPLEEADIPAAAALEAETDEAWSAEALTEELHAKAAQCFGLWSDGTLAGIILWQLAADEASLLKIDIKNSLRRQGLGSFLLQTSMQILSAQGATRFFLEVRGSNIAAITLYQHNGFEKAGVRKGFYKNPVEDAWVMNREDTACIY